jgi:hypothetical protein
MEYDAAKIAEAIKAAAEHAKQFANSDDGGTSKSNAVFILAKGMSEEQAREISKLSGVPCVLLKRTPRGRILYISGTEGKANRRTKTAEAMKWHLRKAGFEASVTDRLTNPKGAQRK